MIDRGGPPWPYQPTPMVRDRTPDCVREVRWACPRLKTDAEPMGWVLAEDLDNDRNVLLYLERL